MPGETGMLIEDPRRARPFAIPWHDMLLVGTTDDVEQRDAEFDPKVSEKKKSTS